jgi:hypothetical protein
MIHDAEGRVADLFGGYSAAPRIIVAADAESAKPYSSNTLATIHVVPFRQADVVFGPEGMFDLDVIAHELAHIEHLERVGRLVWWLTPTWFIEGLAMQVDHRPKYAEASLLQAAAHGEPLPQAEEMYTVNQFMRGDLPLNYAAARATVGAIYGQLGASGLSLFLGRQHFGTNFQRSLETVRIGTADASPGSRIATVDDCRPTTELS